MMAAGLRVLDSPAGSVVVIENVGNLVRPAFFDLGEHSKVVITSVTEGAEKPIKYSQLLACIHSPWTNTAGTVEAFVI